MLFGAIPATCRAADAQHSPARVWQLVIPGYFIGIVDVLIEYGLRKRLEHLLHTVKGVGQTAP